MEFWRAEMLIEIHKEKTEDENRRRKKEEEKSGGNMPSMAGMISQQQNAFKSMTSGGFSKMMK